MTLVKTQIRHAPLSNRIMLTRFGKDPRLALEQRDATSEFYQALVSFAFDGKMPCEGEAVEFQFGGGDEQFVITITRRKNA